MYATSRLLKCYRVPLVITPFGFFVEAAALSLTDDDVGEEEKKKTEDDDDDEQDAAYIPFFLAIFPNEITTIRTP